MLFIGICGASGSGKSTLAESIQQSLGEENCLILQQDSYYLDHSDISFEERVKLNYDRPDMFDHDQLLADISNLLNGKAINRKCYDFSHHCRADLPDEMIYPKEVIILEGIHCFYDARLLDKMYLKLYMNVEADICLLRRIKRDILERGRDIDEISNRYLNDVKPMFEKYIRNYRQYADVIVTGGGENSRVVEILRGYVKDSMNDELHA